MVLASLLLALGFSSLRNYSVTWDEALGDLFFGERYLSFFTSLDAAYLDFGTDPYPANHVPDLSSSPFRERPWEYYPFANTLAAASSVILSRHLGLLDPFEGFHALNLFLGALLILVLEPVVRLRFGALAALVAMLLLFLSPRIVCDLMANIKDFPTMVLFSLAVVAAFLALERGSVRALLGAGGVWGLALATKANALFLPGIPLAVLALGGLPPAWRGRTRALVLALGAAAALGIVVLLAAWPYLWADPVNRLTSHLRYIAFRKFQTRPEHTEAPLEAILFTTPIPFLALALIGLAPLLARVRRRDRAALLPLAWIAIVLVRLHLPGAINFDGVRHFLEIFPPMAILAGAGASWLATRLQYFLGPLLAPPRARAAALVLAVVLPLGSSVWSLARVHPFETTYWNALAGGLAGARAQHIAQASDYWGASYRIGLGWLNEHAPRDTVLAVPIAEHIVRLVAPQWLRPDIRLAALTSAGTPDIGLDRVVLLREAARERPVYVMFVLREEWMNTLTKDCQRRLRPEVEWRQGGAPVLAIYRYTPLP